ncbi:MAG: UxaA family hydrolase [Pseudomonadota bacterium]
MTHDPRLIRLAEGDNVLMIGTTLAAGEVVSVGGRAVTLSAPLSLGHKLAARDIDEGEIVLKYNFPIGVAIEAIPLGAHVHVHNVRSDYTPSYIIPEA